jgi:hypothetical protein
MANQASCPECGSETLFPGTVAAHAPGSFGGLFARVHGKIGWFSTDYAACDVKSTICVSCGFIKLFAADPQALFAVYRRATGL